MDLLGRKIIANKGQFLQEFVQLMVSLSKSNKDNQELAPLFEKFLKAKDKVVSVTQQLGKLMTEDVAMAFLQATPYLEMFSHLSMAFYLLQGAVKAQGPLEKIYKEAGAKDESTKAQLLVDNSEAAFYHGRVASARYFVNSVLPQVHALAENVLSGDKAPLDIVYPV